MSAPVTTPDVYRAGTVKRERRLAVRVDYLEAEAMPASILRGRLRQHIERLLPEQALRIAQEAARSEREVLGMLADEVEEPYHG